METPIIDSLQPAEEHYRALFATMAQGVVYQDRDGRIVSANPAAERILGHALDQLRSGAPIASPPDNNPGRTVIREDGSAFPRDAYPTALALRTGRAVRDVVMGIYHPGEDAYRWISVDATPFFALGDDKPVLVYAILDDITARRAAEQARAELLAREREAAARLQAVLDVLPVGVIIADTRGSLAQANEAARALWGGLSTEQSVEGYGAYRGWWPATGQPLAPEEWAMARALRSGEVCTGEEVLIETFDGARKTMLNSAAPIRDDTGAIVGVVVAMIDITARKRLERRTQETLNALLAMARALVAPPGETALTPDAPATPDVPATTRAVARQLLDVTRSVLDCRRASITAYDATTGLSHVSSQKVGGGYTEATA